ncbi:hypothetical protein DPV78_003388 [Talaromyces pinophilus]|nr:hypothetical protein DPV78_003388 [Talaromyces pinophilus]
MHNTTCSTDLPITAQDTTTDIRETARAITLAEFIMDSRLLDRFKEVDQRTMGTTEQNAQ